MAEEIVVYSRLPTSKVMVGLNLNLCNSYRATVVGFLYLESMTSTGALSSEYRTLTEGCGVLDRSERGKLALAGAEAKAFLQGQVTNDVESLVPGEGCYAAFLTPKGKMLGDLRILDAGD